MILFFSRIKRHLSILLALLLINIHPSFATDYYVSTTGNDMNNGTSLATAFRTINYAVNYASLVGGDVINIKGGTYIERVIMTKSGTSANSRITIKNYNNEVVTLDGASLTWDYVDGVDGLFEIRSRYVTLDGIRVINVVAHANSAGILVRGPSTSFVTVIRCTTVNTRTSGIAIWGRTFGADYSGATDIRIEANDISGAVNDGYHEHLTISQGVDRFEICWNKVHDQTLEPKDINLPIGIDAKINVRNGKIYGNEVYKLYKSNGIYVDGWDAEAYNIDIYNNIIHNVDNTGIPIGAEEGGTARDIKVYNNLIYNTGANGLSVNGSNNTINNNANSVYDISFYNNTVYGCSYYAAHVQNVNATPNIVFKNNIFSQNVWSNAITVYSTNANNVTVENNITNGAQNAWITGMQIKLGTNNNNNIPNFAFIGGNNFRLAPNSPAINAATNTLVPTFDLDFVARPNGGAYDIGAYEYVASVLPLSKMQLKAKAINRNNVILNWVTTDEIAVNKFELQKSFTGINFEKIHETNAQNTALNNYTYTDYANTNNEEIFYRLKQIDNNGSIAYSNIARIKTKDIFQLSIFPNPATDVVYISTDKQLNAVELLSANGQLIKSFKPNSTNIYKLTDVKRGVYFLKIITTNNLVETKQLEKL
jgi:hypothetical protein